MKILSIMHVAFFTDQMDAMIDFYTRILGGKIKAVTKYGIYADRPDNPAMQAIGREDPDRLFNVYVEVAPLQFVELFAARPGQKPHNGWNEHIDYSHFALLTDDIFAAREEMESKGLAFDTEISKGPSETWKMWAHDPDGNKVEIMQFTENSVQVKGDK